MRRRRPSMRQHRPGAHKDSIGNAEPWGRRRGLLVPPGMNGISDRIGQALLLQRAGDLAGARYEAERALAEHPDSPDLLQLLGMIRCQLGDLEEGAALLRRALEKEPYRVATR